MTDNEPRDNTFAKAIGTLLGYLVFLAFILIATPWFGLGAVNRLFDLSIPHTFLNYVYVWTIVLIVRGVPARVFRQAEPSD